MPPRETPSPGSSLALLTLPFSFTQQDHLLGSDDLIKEAKVRGSSVDSTLLQELHNRRLLLPLFRVSDTPSEGRRISVPAGILAINVRGWVLQAALEGRARDPREEGYSANWPYVRPADQDPCGWWNGFAYSYWQLLDLADALNELKFIKLGFLHDYRANVLRRRARTQALVTLSPRYLPGILGTVNIPPGTSEEDLWRFRSSSDVSGLLKIAGFPKAGLLKEAERLLTVARMKDPMKSWLPLLRHAGYKGGWSELRGAPLDFMWYRIAAEILLRAHEDLAAAGQLEPLPDISGWNSWTALHDRLTPRQDNADSLERALGSFGLSPHPRVLLLVEGETELHQLSRLLAEFGLTQPHHVRVQRAKGSKVNPQLIARYNIAPRIGRRINDRWLLDATPTVLVIAMDAENKWETAEKRTAERSALQGAIREEVQWQGADIGQDELDFLVRIHVWGADKYELANFSDDELIPQIRIIAERKHGTLPETWNQDMRNLLQKARKDHLDIKVPLGRMRLGDPKVELAEMLWPVLLAKCEQELTEGTIITPVLKIVQEVRELVARLSGGGYSLPAPNDWQDNHS